MRRPSSPSSKRRYIIGALLVLALAGMFFIGLKSPSVAEQSAEENAAAPEAPEMEVLTVNEKPLRLWNQFSGRLAAIDRVDIRPQVSGTITEIAFIEDSLVEAGDKLFVIDARPFEAAIARQNAALAAAQAEVSLRNIELKRAKKLVQSDAVSQSRLDEARSNYSVAVAAVEAAKAQLTQAQLDLDYAIINTPITGRISRAEVTLGNLVQAGSNAPLLTSIVSEGKIFAEFDVDEQRYVQIMQQAGSDVSKMPVELTLTADKNTRYKGVMHSFDNALNATSGTIRARAVFENSDRLLVPGMFADIRLGTPTQQNVITLPERLIGTDQARRFVYVIDAENKITYREIKLGASTEGARVVLSGLKSGEQVLANGIMKVRPGMVITPIEADQKPDGVIVGEAEKSDI